MSSDLKQEVELGNTKASSKQQRRYTWTSFEEAPPEYDDQFLSYLIYGREICPSTGRPHWQGYLETKTKRTFSSVLNWFHENEQKEMKLFISAGSSVQNQQYCKKQNDWEEFGKPMAQGKRTDLDLVRTNILSGMHTADDIIVSGEVHLGVRYSRWLDRLTDIANRTTRRTEPTTITWLWGPTGSGKSRAANEMAPNAYWHNTQDNDWWDQYNGEADVIIDDFRGEIRYSVLLKLADRYPVTVKRRGRAPIPFTSRRIIITAPTPPHLTYQGMDMKEGGIDQLLRRIESTVKYPIPHNGA